MNEITKNIPDFCKNCPEMKLKIDTKFAHDPDSGFLQFHHIQCEHLSKCLHLRQYFFDNLIIKND